MGLPATLTISDKLESGVAAQFLFRSVDEPNLPVR